MINIIREPNSPESLETDEIRKYIEDYILYQIDPETNPKPKKTAAYRNSDLLEAFDRCFFSKCYLTETKFGNSYKMDVEHFVPQSENALLVYEWTNLYPADHKANMMKPRLTPNGGYLDPCADEDDVENDIFYSLTALGEKPNFEAKNSANQKASNTATLLERLHNGFDEESNKSTLDLRFSIHKKYKYILIKIIEWREQVEGTQKEVQKRNELKLLLSKDSSFTMLCRSIPAVQNLPSHFFE